MPGTLRYRPTPIDVLVTQPRMSSYRTVFQPANDIELMGVYLWNTHVCGIIYPLIGMAEISLRNSIDQALTGTLGKFWWSVSRLRYRSFAQGVSPPKVVSAVRDNFSAAGSKYIVEKRRRYNVRGHVVRNHHGVIAKTELSTFRPRPRSHDAELSESNLSLRTRLETIRCDHRGRRNPNPARKNRDDRGSHGVNPP